MHTKESIICSKYDIILSKKNENNYNIKFSTKNNLNIDRIINENLYNLIGTLNKDIIEKVEIVDKISDNELNILYIFNRFGEELGISKKHLFIKCFIIKEIDKIEFKSYSIPYNKIINTEPILCKEASLVIFNLQQDNIIIDYNFIMIIDEDLPIYMNNIVGILMKKILYNLKLFIDKVCDNYRYEKDNQTI